MLLADVTEAETSFLLLYENFDDIPVIALPLALVESGTTTLEDTSKIDCVNFLLGGRVATLVYELVDNFFVASDVLIKELIENDAFNDVCTIDELAIATFELVETDIKLLDTVCEAESLVNTMGAEGVFSDSVRENVCILEILRLVGDEKLMDFMVFTEFETMTLEYDTSKVDSVKFLLEEEVPTLIYKLVGNLFVANELFTTSETENKAFIDVGTTNIFVPVDTKKMVLRAECNLETFVNRVNDEEAFCDTVCTIIVWILEIFRLSGDEKVFDFMVLTGFEAKTLEDTTKIDSVKFLLEEKVATFRYELMDTFFVACVLFGTTNVFALIDTNKKLLGTEYNLETLVNRVDTEEAFCDTVCTTSVWILEMFRLTGDEVFDFMVLNGFEAKALEEDTSKIDFVKFLLEEKVADFRYELMGKFFVAIELFGTTNVLALIDTDKKLLGT